MEERKAPYLLCFRQKYHMSYVPLFFFNSPSALIFELTGKRLSSRTHRSYPQQPLSPSSSSSNRIICDDRFWGYEFAISTLIRLSEFVIPTLIRLREFVILPQATFLLCNVVADGEELPN